MSSTSPSSPEAPSGPAIADPADTARAKPLPRRLPLFDASTTLVPARMLNEVLYCERLMVLEWVQGEWADNYFTMDGRAVHDRADRPGRALKPRPAKDDGHAKDDEQTDLPYTARSVWLSSETLGITSKIDVVDVDGGRVVPIEYKRGKRPDVPMGVYMPERVQVCAQVLLLREHGFACSHGEIYFAKDRHRQRVEIDEGLIEVTHIAVERARELAEKGTLPPPLVDSPKCHGCSLVGICLPDETHALEAEPPAVETDTFEDFNEDWGFPEKPTERAVRRLFPARDDRLPLYVQEQGSMLRLDGERLVVQRRGAPAVHARLTNTSHVAVYGSVHVTTPALRALLDRGIPLLFFSYGGWYAGRTLAADSKNVELRLAQYAHFSDPAFCLRMARGFVASKVLNSRALLRRNATTPEAAILSELRHLARKARRAESLETLLGIEGTGARTYFKGFSAMLKGEAASAADFDLDGRNRRPPKDPINALLSFCYSLLHKEFLLATTAVGLDPLLGFYHKPHFGRPALALDLMEEFRPVLADSTVINALNTGVIQPDDFVRSAGSVALTAPARKRLLLAFERRMDQLVTHPLFDYRVSYRRVLEIQARLLSRVLLGELQYYPEFRVR